MEPFVFADGSYQSLFWIAFGLFVGTALAIDLGVIDGVRRRISSKKYSTDNNSQFLSHQEKNKKRF
jgi:hypothetical protein